MQKHFLLLCCLCGFFSLKAQKNNAFYDAQRLGQQISNGQVMLTEESAKLFMNYLPAEKNGINITELEAHLKKNPFLAPYLSFSQIAAVRGLSDKPMYDERGFGDPPASATGLSLSPATFVLGLTDFLVRRTKQELHISFFKEFNKKMEESEELQLIFPQTAKVLKTLEEDLYQFGAFWEVLRSGFAEDMDRLPEHLSDYFQMSSRVTDPKTKALAADCFEVLDLFKNEKAPTEVIRYLGKDAFVQQGQFEEAEMKVLQQNLQFIALISEALEYMDESRYWVGQEEFNSLLKDSIHADLFVGLIYEKGKNISLGGQTLGSYLESLRKKQLEFRNFMRAMQKFLAKGSELHKKVQESRRKARNSGTEGAAPYTQEEKAQDFYYFVDASLELTEMAYQFKKMIAAGDNTQDSLFYNYVATARELNKLIYDLNSKKYAVAIIGAIIIIEKLMPDNIMACEQKLLLKYGSFIATAIQAKTPEEVSAAIEAFALPPGSSAMKKYSRFSMSLNAYVGASGGMEYLNGLSGKPYYALTTPLGISFNFGFKGAGSLGILASVIDVGALTAFRFADPNANPLPDFKVTNIFAPGGYLVYGIPKFPISIGVGGQMGPYLRTVNAQQGTINAKGWRMGAFIAVDIPLVSIFTTSKQYKACRK